MKNIIFESFKPILIGMRFVGLYPGTKTSILMKFWAHTLYFMWATLVLLALVNFLLEKNPEIQQLIVSQVFLINGGAAVFKMLLFLKNRYRIKKCANHFGEFTPKNKEEREIVENCVKMSKLLSKVYVTGLVINASVWVLRSLFEKERKLFLSIWLPYDVTSGPFIFYFTYFFFAAPLCYGGIWGVSIDPFTAGLTLHATAQVKILKHILTNIHTYSGSDTERVLKFENASEVVYRCIDHHNSILEFVAEYENCFSWIVFCQFSASTLGLCLCSIGIQQDDLTNVDIALYITSYIVMLFQILLYCFYGTLLFEENESLNNAIYAGLWYKCDTRIRKHLLLIMERSKVPMLITAGKFVPLTLRTFTSVMKTSYSLIAVLNRYQ